MRIRNLDNNWDWTFGQSQINYVKDEKSILLDIQMRLKEWYQDCFFALQNGIPWSVRLGFHNQKDLLDRDVKNIVSNTYGVLNFNNFTSLVNNRRYRATMTIYTQYTNEGIDFIYNMEL